MLSVPGSIHTFLSSPSIFDSCLTSYSIHPLSPFAPQIVGCTRVLQVPPIVGCTRVQVLSFYLMRSSPLEMPFSTGIATATYKLMIPNFVPLVLPHLMISTPPYQTPLLGYFTNISSYKYPRLNEMFFSLQR